MAAYIFDMDGVMIDSELHWIHDEKALLKKWIPSWNDDDHRGILGLSMQDIHRRLVERYGFTMNQEGFLEAIEVIALKIYGEYADLLEGFYELLSTLKKRQYAIGLASSSRRHWIQMILDRFELHPFFDAVVSYEDIQAFAQGKPHPDIYLHAAKLLNVDPAECIVFEDAQNGVRAGKAAGMAVIGLRNGFNDHQDLSEADFVLEDSINMN
ncbi:HAD family phosphatase [Candidatus Peregrinibacteria bacterium]|nr:MAG: HAD family phosphatase [Candidatus Peregrinibacteria bacterium]